jgi:Na+/H+ antiporter NhaC
MTTNRRPRKRARLGIGLCVAAVFTATLLGTASDAPARSDEHQSALTGIPFRYRLAAASLPAESDTLVAAVDGIPVFRGAAADVARDGIMLNLARNGRHEITLSHAQGAFSDAIHAIPAWFSVLPPIVAIVIALVFRQVILALLSGIWLGNLFLTGYRPLAALLRIVDRNVIETLSDPGQGSDHASIIVFTLLLGGMVGIMYRMGGMHGVIERVSRLATTARRGQLAGWFMGVLIFFDDYANTLIVGNSLRPLTDRLRISREKLAYIVDSTAAPITSVAVITSWIGFQVSLIGQSFVAVGVDRNPFTAFISAIPYCYYPLLAVLFVLMIALMNRDFGGMLAAERRSRATGKTVADGAVLLSNIDAEHAAPSPDARPRWINGLAPIIIVIAVAFAGLVVTGRRSLAERGASGGLLAALQESDSFVALLWCSMAGCAAAALLALVQRLLSLTELVAAWMNGIRAMLIAIVILVLAWCIGSVCTDLHTADYLVHMLSGFLDPRFLPLVVFLVAMAIAFSTGTSWGTMSILTPIVVPLAIGTARAAGLEDAEFDRILSASIASILSGAVFGDHCSPISDTTIMSSMAAACDHVDHVRTQLPYAATVAAAAVVCGYIPTAFGLPSGAALALGAIVLFAGLRIFGRSSDVVSG